MILRNEDRININDMFNYDQSYDALEQAKPRNKKTKNTMLILILGEYILIYSTLLIILTKFCRLEFATTNGSSPSFSLKGST